MLSFFWAAAQQKMNTPNLTGSATNQDSENKKKAKKSKQNVEKVPSSDAILSCPACMTTLCIDCQRLVFKLSFTVTISRCCKNDCLQEFRMIITIFSLGQLIFTGTQLLVTELLILKKSFSRLLNQPAKSCSQMINCVSSQPLMKPVSGFCFLLLHKT